MPRGKKIGRIELRADRELIAALDWLKKVYPDTSRTELIRESVINEAKRHGFNPTKLGA